jgi:hypothetical protein
VRRRFEERFSAARMARDYVSLYRSLLETPAHLDLDGKGLRTQPRPNRVNGNGKQSHFD